MTNLEYHKEKIMRMADVAEINSFEILRNLHDEFNIEMKYGRSLEYTFLEWGYSEYVEPYKLTRFEKDILENTDRSITVIWKHGQTNMVVADGIDSDYMFMISKAFPKAKFDCLNWDEKYKIADILDNCEVIDE